MLNNFFEIIVIYKYPLIGLFLCMSYLCIYWTSIFNFFNLKAYNSIQKIHRNEVPRLGGIFAYIFFWVIYLLDFFDNNFFVNILISAIPFVIISFKEDLFHNTKPYNRLIVMVLSCLIFFNINPLEYPLINFPLIGNLISIYPINIIFFTFSVLVIMNGMNLIDGVNGLFSLSVISQLMSILIIVITFNDDMIINLSLVLMLPIIIFILFNFPFGKIFFGDLGAYLYGFMISIITIYIFGKYSQLLSWMAIQILIYPAFELLFSFSRKFIKNKNPLEADNLHLHTLLYKYFLAKKLDLYIVNCLTIIALMFFWLSPTLFLSLTNTLGSTLYFLFVFIIVYICLYLFIFIRYKN